MTQWWCSWYTYSHELELAAIFLLLFSKLFYYPVYWHLYQSLLKRYPKDRIYQYSQLYSSYLANFSKNFCFKDCTHLKPTFKAQGLITSVGCVYVNLVINKMTITFLVLKEFIFKIRTFSELLYQVTSFCVYF